MRHILACRHAAVTKSSKEPAFMSTISIQRRRENNIMTGCAIMLKNIRKVEKLKKVHIYILSYFWKGLKQFWHLSFVQSNWGSVCLFLSSACMCVRISVF